jgi:DNA repair REX1-B
MPATNPQLQDQQTTYLTTLLQKFKSLQSHRPALYRDFNQGFQLLLDEECTQAEFAELTAKLGEIFNSISTQINQVIEQMPEEAKAVCLPIQQLEQKLLKQVVSSQLMQVDEEVDYSEDCAVMKGEIEETIDQIMDQMAEVQEMIAQLDT